MKPQDYSARVEYRPPAGWYRRLNWLGVGLTSLGLAPRDAVTLQARGRTSGKSRWVAILRTRYQGEDYLVALAGESQWVRNVRAAGGEAVIRRRGAQHVHLEEVAPADRPDIIAEYLQAGLRRSGAEANANQARFYFGLGPDPSPRRHPSDREELPRVPRHLRQVGPPTVIRVDLTHQQEEQRSDGVADLHLRAAVGVRGMKPLIEEGEDAVECRAGRVAGFVDEVDGEHGVRSGRDAERVSW